MDDDIAKPVDPGDPHEAVQRPRGSAAPEGDAAAATPVYDRPAAMEHVGDDVTVLRAIVEMFLDQGPERLRAIGDAVSAHSPGDLERAAHALKGSSATMGLERVRTLSMALENLGASGSLTGADALVSELARAMEQGLDALRGELGDAAGDTP